MSKLSRLRNNIAAISHALTAKEPNINILKKYSGFGGMTFVLCGLDKRIWKNTDLDCYDDFSRLHGILRDASHDANQYQAWVQSMKSSVLSAYYTPEDFVETFSCKLSEYCLYTGAVFSRFLDPAAGNGVFIDNLSSCLGISTRNAVAFEKDLLTSLILSGIGREKFTVESRGFETISDTSLGTFDLVSTNVPFGNISVYDKLFDNQKYPVRIDATRMIHRYYVLKGLDCLRNGGIEAYIITSNYLNHDSQQLYEALKQSRLIGAYRLPNNLFRSSNTEVGTDFLLLQKDLSKSKLTADESLLLTQYESNGCPTNMYFSLHTDHVIATDTKVDTDAYGKRGFVYNHSGGLQGILRSMDDVLHKDMIANINKSLLVSVDSNRNKNQKYGHGSKQTGMNEQEKMLHLIHSCYTELYENETKNMEEDPENRNKLNSMYDDYVERYGFLNKPDNSAAIKNMKLHDLLGLELLDEENKCWTKADIMLHPVAFSTDDIHSASTPQEALARSLNEYGKPNMSYMSALTGLTTEQLADELTGDVFWNPLNEQYEIKAKFICGNVIEKIEEIKKKCEGSSDKRVSKSLAALQDAVPEPIPFDDLDFNLGERWIDPKLYSKFASEFFDMPGERPEWYGDSLKVTVQYNNLIDQFAVSANCTWNEKIGTQYAVRSETNQKFDGIDLFTHALHNTCPKLMRYKRDSSGHYVYNDKYEREKEEDPEKIQLANAKIEEIRQAFQDWLMRQPTSLKEQLAELYNKRFNCFVKPHYDGSHQTFPGINMKALEKKYGIKHIYDSQKDCVWMLVLNGGGICDHEVGSGKTLIMCMAAHEMKRLGLCHKPMIIGLKANVSAIAETYKTAYPKSRILFAKESDYSADNRVSFFNQMKNNDFDCLIMSHEQFSRIPQSEQTELDLIREELEQIDKSINIVGCWDFKISSRVLRGLEIRKRNMEAKMARLMESISNKSDNVVDFHMMGIDHIFVDESHQFKNLGFTTRHDRVAGLGNTEGSKRALNLLMAIRTIQKRTGRDLGATFLSGTTVTNSLTELYSLFRYLRPKALAKQNITCFDAWAAIFTKKSQEFEFSITNQIVMKERFRYFIKVPELAMFYNEITDFRTAEDVGIERPEKHAMLLHIKPTPDQEEFIKTLMKFAKSGDFSLIGINNATDKQQRAKMLYATDLARKMSLDMRMIDESYPDHPRSKANRCAALVKKYYEKYNDCKGTQLVFSDISTWQSNSEWSVYGEIKRKLVEEYGIPEQEIRFIQECKNDAKKQQLIEQVNNGKVRVLFGSTSMLGTGVNAQKRVVAVHHLDTPWRPSDLEQRDGRAIRKGNEIAKLYAGNKVDVIIYAVERSLDSYKFNLLHCKQTFISQLKRGQLAKRTLDEGSMDENGMNFSEYMAILSGNTDLLERAKLEKRITALESERRCFLREQHEQEHKQKSLCEENSRHEKNISSAKSDYEQFMQSVERDASGNVLNNIEIDGHTPPSNATPGSDEWKKSAGDRMLKIADNARTNGTYLPIGSIYGFTILVKSEEVGFDQQLKMQYENRFFIQGSMLKYSHNSGRLNRTSSRLSADNPLLALQRIPSLISQWQNKMEENNVRIMQLNSIMGMEWTKEEELRMLKTELGQLDRKINQELNRNKDSDSSEQVKDAA